MLNLVTAYGEFDLTIEPTGVGGYAQIAPRAVTKHIDRHSVQVASLADVIASKTAAGRPKDLSSGWPVRYAALLAAG